MQTIIEQMIAAMDAIKADINKTDKQSSPGQSSQEYACS